MRRPVPTRMTLWNPSGGRKYLNALERRRVLRTIQRIPPKVRLFCLTLMLTGSRISETLALTPDAIDLSAGVANLQTLKRRRRGLVRQVPLPPPVLQALAREFGLRAAQRDPTRALRRLWPWSRTTAWRRIKQVLAQAGVHGAPAMPKAFRHSFGVSAFQANVPPNLVQRWMGHASLRTTLIYADVMDEEERSFASRLWRRFKR